MVHRVFLFLQCACHSCASGNWIWRESYLSISCGTERFYQRLFKNQFFSDLKGSFCIPVMRIKYCISPKSYYTVMNIPLHCQEPGGGAPWCPSYWWAVILLKGSVWTRSQKAWIFSCGVPKTSGSSWAAATLVIPVSADLPSHCTKWVTEDPHYLSRSSHQPTGWGSEEKSDIHGCSPADATVHIQELGL